MIVTVLRNPGSRSARRIAEGLRALGHRVGLDTVGCKRSTRGSRYIINWGVSRWHMADFRARHTTLSNEMMGVDNCRDKILTLRRLTDENVPCIQSAVHADAGWDVAVQEWLREDKKIVVRHTTTGHSGAGIEIIREGGNIPAAPLYTRYFRKDAEYRVHVAFGEVIHIQQKRRRNGWEGEQEDALVRTHANGYVFTTQNLDCDAKAYRPALVDLALKAAAACGVNHAAVDILVRHRRQGPNMVVCELNSAPACDADSTREAYVRLFSGRIQALRGAA